jgi:hypothetical protein
MGDPGEAVWYMGGEGVFVRGIARTQSTLLLYPQHYNPMSGQSYGAKDVGMSTLVCDWIQRKQFAQ